MSKQQLQEDINDTQIVIQGGDLIKVLEAAKMLMEWPMPDGMGVSMNKDWNELCTLVDEL